MKKPETALEKAESSPTISIISPRTLNREERKLQEQLALFEKMESRNEKKKGKQKRQNFSDNSTSTTISRSEMMASDSEEAMESIKIENEGFSEDVSRDSPASFMDDVEKIELDVDSKRKLDLSASNLPEEPLFKRPKTESMNADPPVRPTPIKTEPLVRKLSLKDFLQKRNIKTPSPSSTPTMESSLNLSEDLAKSDQ